MSMREVIEEPTAHAGVTRQRVLTLLDRLHRNGEISFDQFSAGHILRHAIMRVAPQSVGVSSYGLSVGKADPTTKADRVGQRLTGFRIDYEGHVYWRGGREWNEDQRALEDMLFWAVGVKDESGTRRLNIPHAHILIEVLLEAERPPSLASITRRLTDFYGATSKKSAAFSRGVISVWLSRLAQHLRLTK